jgi:hypothetical protein
VADNNNASTTGPAEEPETGPIVEITINGVVKPIHRGRQTVSAIKTLGGVPQADELAEDVGGELKPLKDDGSVTIKGGEVFFSHPGSGGSSGF